MAGYGFELVTVGLDALGASGCREFMEAAKPTHPMLLDTHHVLAAKFGVINIPQAIWIDEDGMIVRPAEAAPAPPQPVAPAAPPPPAGAMPPRFVEMMGEAMKIPRATGEYHAALRDWIINGKRSVYALSPDEVMRRSRPRSAEVARGHAHFELACALEIDGHHDRAVVHFQAAHALVPDSWTFRRQAWSLEVVGDGPLRRFWQGPHPDRPEDWPYAGDWLSDVRKVGAENYSEPWQP